MNFTIRNVLTTGKTASVFRKSYWEFLQILRQPIHSRDKNFQIIFYVFIKYIMWAG